MASTWPAKGVVAERRMRTSEDPLEKDRQVRGS
jgi:hypothetical protein